MKPDEQRASWFTQLIATLFVAAVAPVFYDCTRGGSTRHLGRRYRSQGFTWEEYFTEQLPLSLVICGTISAALWYMRKRDE